MFLIIICIIFITNIVLTIMKILFIIIVIYVIMIKEEVFMAQTLASDILVAPKIITFYLDKGGGGKTSGIYNFNGYVGDIKNKRVLTFDGDRSQNLTKTYGVQGSRGIYDIFVNDEFEIYHTSQKNVDVIIGSEKFCDYNINWGDYQNTFMVLYSWITRNLKFLAKEYDYITIDAHNDTTDVTANLLAVADVVVAVGNADANSFAAWEELNELFLPRIKKKAADALTKVSYVHAEPYLIANRIPFKGNNVANTVKEFLEVIQRKYGDKFLGVIPERDTVIRSLLENKSVFELYQEMPESTLTQSKRKASEKKFVDGMASIFDKIIENANMID